MLDSSDNTGLSAVEAVGLFHKRSGDNSRDIAGPLLTNMTALTDTDRQLIKDHTRALNRYVDLERTKKRKETWVKVGIIKDLTGWDKEEMRRARDTGIIRSKHEEGQVMYLLESVPEQLIKNRTT